MGLAVGGGTGRCAAGSRSWGKLCLAAARYGRGGGRRSAPCQPRLEVAELCRAPVTRPRGAEPCTAPQGLSEVGAPDAELGFGVCCPAERGLWVQPRCRRCPTHGSRPGDCLCLWHSQLGVRALLTATRGSLRNRPALAASLSPSANGKSRWTLKLRSGFVFRRVLESQLWLERISKII